MNAQLHIAVVSTFYPNAAEPLRAVFVRNLAAAMARDAQLSIVSPVPYAPPLSAVTRWRSLRSIPHRVMDGGSEVLHPRFLVIPKCAAATGLSYFAGTFRTLRALARQRRIDVLHAHCAYPDAVGVALAAALLDLPFAVTCHGSDINVYAEKSSIRPQLRWALRRAGVLIAVSRAMQRRIEELVGGPSLKSPQATPRVVHIPCAGVDSRVFTVREQEAARRALALDPSGRVIVFAGQLVPIKAVQVLLEAWEILAVGGRLRASDRLAIIGEGPERAALAARAAA
ncbi:MAG TPA: glycosyltransferase, partial [Steroidobacteraceae bacterium]